MNIQNGNLYLMGHVVGGFGTDKTEALIEGSSTMQTGFLIKCSAVDGTWLGGAIGENSIGGYYGAFENENGKIYTYGYALGEAYLVTYNASTWDIENEYSLVKGGSTTAWGCLFDGGQLLTLARSNAKSANTILDGAYTIKAQKMPDHGSRFLLLSKFGTGTNYGLISSETAKEQSVKVYSGKNQIFVEAGESSEIQILNTYGQIVKSMTVSTGKHAISMPKGIYIVNKTKVVVY